MDVYIFKDKNINETFLEKYNYDVIWLHTIYNLATSYLVTFTWPDKCHYQCLYNKCIIPDL